MVVSTINRMARGMDFPSLLPDGSGPVTLVNAIGAPSTAWQNKGYMPWEVSGKWANNGLTGLGDFSVLGDYFTSANYYLGYIAIAGLALLLFSGGGSKRAAREKYRRASIKGQIARDQALL